MNAECKAGYGFVPPSTPHTTPPTAPPPCELCPAGYISGPNAWALMPPRHNFGGRKLQGRHGFKGGADGGICVACPSGSSSTDRTTCTGR